MGNGDEMKARCGVHVGLELDGLRCAACEDDEMRAMHEREMRWFDDEIARELSTMPANAFEAQARIGAVNDLRARRAEAARMVAAWRKVTP